MLLGYNCFQILSVDKTRNIRIWISLSLSPSLSQSTKNCEFTPHISNSSPISLSLIISYLISPSVGKDSPRADTTTFIPGGCPLRHLYARQSLHMDTLLTLLRLWHPTYTTANLLLHPHTMHSLVQSHLVTFRLSWVWLDSSSLCCVCDPSPPPLFFFWPHHVAGRILIPWTGIQLMPPAVEERSLNHLTSREVPVCDLLLSRYAS